jgi:hypothetical protein
MISSVNMWSLKNSTQQHSSIVFHDAGGKGKSTFA